jgi:hypothetical protein
MATAQDIARIYTSPRAKKLNELDAYVQCTQYDGKVPWFDTASDCPVFERKPCVNYPIVRTAKASHVHFVLGEGHWPKLTCSPSEDDESIEAEWGLGADDSRVFDTWINVVLVKFAKLKTVVREALGDAMGCRSVAIVASVRRGQLVAETVKASWCTPELDECGEVLSLEIRYPYVVTAKNPATREYEDTCYLYRRVITATEDTVYLPGKTDDRGTEPDWKPDAKRSSVHNLGFCPVIWYPFLKPCSVVGDVDGIAIHEHQLGEIDCLNRTLSQRHRAAVTAGDPQMYEAGVGPDEQVGPMGRTASVTPRGGKVTADDANSDQSTSVYNRPVQTASARKKGPGIIWRYKDDKAHAEYLTLPGDGTKVLTEDGQDLREKLAESLFAVFVDPSSLKMHAAMSGKALAFLFTRQIGFCDAIREDVADKCLLAIVSLLLRIVSKVGSKKGALRLPGLTNILPILARFEQQNDAGATEWLAPRIDPVWGPYFAPNEQDQLFVVQLTTAAKDGGLCTTQQGVDKLSKEGVFEVGSAGEVVDAIKAETAENQKAAMATAHALGSASGEAYGDNDNAGGLDGGAAAEPV